MTDYFFLLYVSVHGLLHEKAIVHLCASGHCLLYVCAFLRQYVSMPGYLNDNARGCMYSYSRPVSLMPVSLFVSKPQRADARAAVFLKP
jgi:hypothetical protein